MKQNCTQNPTLIALIAGVGMFISTLDTSIVTIAIPSLMHVFHAPIKQVSWTISLYALTISASIIFFGKLADRQGCILVYRFGLIVFAISSLLCGLASNVFFLLSARALQGFGAAMIQATTLAIVTQSLAGAKKLKALSIFGMLIPLGPLSGPTIGGFILSHFSWHWLFWLNLPICALSIYGTYRLKLLNANTNSQNLNILSSLLLGLIILSGLLSLQVDSRFIAILGCIMLISLIALTIRERQSKHPLVNYQQFKRCNFTLPYLSIITLTGGFISILILIPIYFQHLLHFTPWKIGLIVAIMPLGAVMSARATGKLAQHLGTQKLMILSMVGMVTSLTILTRLNTHWPLAVLLAVLFLFGISGGLFQTANMLHLCNQTSPHEQASISALIRLMQNISIALVTSMLAFIMTGYAHSLSGIQHGFIFISILSWLTLLSLAGYATWSYSHAS